MVINLDQPRYDQATYLGRAKHFIMLTNPLNAFASDKQLNEAQQVVKAFRATKKMPADYNEEKLWAAKYLYDSAFHPDTGEKMLRIGRMSAQAPMNTLITGCMISFYKSNAAIVFWQWFNQTFNAVVNYSNRAGDAVITQKQLLASYCAACGGALGTALYLNSKVKGMNPLYARLVPFAAVCGANFINIPMMRSTEIIQGTPVFTPDGQRVGNSKIAAVTGIFLVCISRVGMAMPGMTLVPIITNTAVQRRWFRPSSPAIIPFQMALVCLSVTFATPLCCAFFEQKASISVDTVETHIKENAKKISPETTTLYYNKGLELINGTPVFTPAGQMVGNSQIAAAAAIFLTCISRVAMAAPSMTLVPMITLALVQRCWFRRGMSYYMKVPFQIGMAGLFMTLATPLCYALFKQKPNMDIHFIEAPLQCKCKCWCDPRLLLYQRLVPFAAVAAGNFIGIPVLRSNELINGTPVFTPEGLMVGKSQIAAAAGIFLTCVSRVAMAAPAMTLVPMITHALVQRCWFRGGTSNLIYPFQIGMAGLFTMLATPMCYALFKQKPNMNINFIEAPLKEKACQLSPKSRTVYFNKGL